MTRTTLLAFDFDGTLAPICDDPNEVHIARGAIALLEAATRLRGVAVAILTGRDADIARRVDLPGAYLVASHGLEVRGPGGVIVRAPPPLSLRVDASLLEEIAASGMRLETKRHGFALHWRGIPYDAIAPVADSLRAWAVQNDLDVIEGRCVVEARRRGEGKDEALRWLARAVGASRVVYAGDDLTDYGPLRFAAENGRAVFMSSGERDAPPGVVVRSFREMFQLIRQEVMI